MSLNLSKLFVAVAALAGCEQNLLKEIPDAAIDAPDAAILVCPTPTQPLAPGLHVLYLNTEGVTLTHSAIPDSRTDSTPLVVLAGAVVPPFLDGVAGRQAFIAEVVETAQASLAPYSVDIVTTRPTAGNYWEFVLGGSGDSVSGCADCNAVSDFVCSPDSPDAVDLIFDNGMDGAYGPARYASNVLGDLGAIEGMAPVNANDDCMCRVDNCMWDSSVCTYGASAPVTAQAAYSCGRTIEDEPMLLTNALGCR